MSAHKLQIYRNTEGNSGIHAFEFVDNGIIVEFVSGQGYLYNEIAPGTEDMERMKELAIAGHGLATYINQHVRERYARRLW